MSSPSTKTIKRLFALSGNICAFPNCPMPLIDESSGSVIGEICHITARNPDGARYDLTQNDEQRNAFENLILMCPIHHKVIDDDEESYTVERLQQMKSYHQSKSSNPIEINDDLAQGFLTKMDVDISYEVNISTYNQSGGQTAQTIINMLQQPVSTAPKVKLDFKYHSVRQLDGLEEYKLIIDMTNTGSIAISNYRLDIEFPQIFLNPHTVYAVEKPERSNEKFKFLRITQENHRNEPLYPDDNRIVFMIDYKYQGESLDEHLRVKVFIDDKIINTVDKLMREFINI